MKEPVAFFAIQYAGRYTTWPFVAKGPLLSNNKSFPSCFFLCFKTSSEFDLQENERAFLYEGLYIKNRLETDKSNLKMAYCILHIAWHSCCVFVPGKPQIRLFKWIVIAS